MASLLPSHDGLLPYWLLFVSSNSYNQATSMKLLIHRQISSLALFNTVQNYRDKSHTLRTYEGAVAASQVTDFSARMFGTWTFLSCVVRLYAAYRIDVKEVYMLALWTFVIALGQFGSEWLIYGTMKMGKGLVPVLVVAGGSIIWMLVQWNYYVG